MFLSHFNKENCIIVIIEFDFFIISPWTTQFHNHFVPEVKKFMKRSNLPINLDNALGYPNERELKSSDGNIQTIQ